MPELIPILTKEEIHARVAAIGSKISSDFENKDLVLIGVLKGAFIFLSDLMRCLDIPVIVDFIQVSSYGSKTTTSGKINLSRQIEVELKRKDVIIVEDIVDTGLTLSFLIDHINSMGPKSVRTCAMIDKHERRETGVDVDYTGHSIDEGFLVGYGLDYNEKYRELPGIYRLKF